MSRVIKGLPENKHPRWKGSNVGYRSLHYWVEKHLGKPKECIICGKINKKPNGRGIIQWANTNHKYNRVLTDWIQLCCKCHGLFDKTFNHKKNEI